MTTANPNGRVFWAGLVLILAAFTATAQEFRGSLTGKIADPNGAVVPGSKVEIKNVETGIVSTATTGEDVLIVFHCCHLASTRLPSRRKTSTPPFAKGSRFVLPTA